MQRCSAGRRSCTASVTSAAATARPLPSRTAASAMRRLYGADVAGDEPAFRAEGLMLSRDRYGLHWLIGFETADA
jgi:hypothetical protein